VYLTVPPIVFRNSPSRVRSQHGWEPPLAASLHIWTPPAAAITEMKALLSRARPSYGERGARASSRTCLHLKRVPAGEILRQFGEPIGFSCTKGRVGMLADVSSHDHPPSLVAHAPNRTWSRNTVGGPAIASSGLATGAKRIPTGRFTAGLYRCCTDAGVSCPFGQSQPF
jgi:hypothetical protein